VIDLNRPLEKLQQKIATAIDGMSREQLLWHPEGKWCAAEILEHLYLTYTGTIKGFERLSAAGRPQVTPATWAQRRARFIVIGLGYMPSGRKAPKSTVPRGIALEELLAEIVPKITEMEARLAQAEERFGLGDLLDHPILGPLSAAEWSKFHLVHGRHHLNQVRRARKKCET
jgi:hypothetical protein